MCSTVPWIQVEEERFVFVCVERKKEREGEGDMWSWKTFLESRILCIVFMSGGSVVA